MNEKYECRVCLIRDTSVINSLCTGCYISTINRERAQQKKEYILSKQAAVILVEYEAPVAVKPTNITNRKIRF